MKESQRFVLVDDDAINNFILKEFVQLILKTPYTIVDFTDPENGLGYIASTPQHIFRNQPAILFLDINMPSMTGWEFLEKFSLLNEDIKKMFTVYIMSSSINPLDKKKADSNPYVSGFIIKPISEDFLLKICAQGAI